MLRWFLRCVLTYFVYAAPAPRNRLASPAPALHWRPDSVAEYSQVDTRRTVRSATGLGKSLCRHE